MTFEFDLVAETECLHFVEGGWEKARLHLLEFQPAKRVSLVGAPASRIRVLAHGDRVDIASGLLSRVEELAGTALRVEMH